MAYSCSNTYSLIPYFLLLLSSTVTLSTARPSMKLTDDDLSKLCSKTVDPSFCAKVLKSDPRTSTADLKGLATISIDIAKRYGTLTLNLIKSLGQQEPNPELKDKYLTCSHKYNSAINNLDQSKQGVVSGDYASLADSAVSASDAVTDCQDAFEAPPSAPSSLSKGIEDMENACNIVFEVAGML